MRDSTYALTILQNYSVGESLKTKGDMGMFVEWRKIKGRYYAYARITEWNSDNQRSMDMQIYLGKTPEKAIEKLGKAAEIAGVLQRKKVEIHRLAQKLREKYPGQKEESVGIRNSFDNTGECNEVKLSSTSSTQGYSTL
jgi:hypothetical protein